MIERICVLEKNHGYRNLIDIGMLRFCTWRPRGRHGWWGSREARGARFAKKLVQKSYFLTEIAQFLAVVLFHSGSILVHEQQLFSESIAISIWDCEFSEKSFERFWLSSMRFENSKHGCEFAKKRTPKKIDWVAGRADAKTPHHYQDHNSGVR